MAKALRLARPRVGERLADRLAGDELLAHQPHRQVDAFADQRLAAACRPAARGALVEARLAVRRDELAGDEQAPRSRALTNSDGLVAPRCSCQWPLLILSRISASRVARVGNAQQRLGQAHQRDAFLRRQRVFPGAGPAPRPARPAARLPLAQRLRQATRRGALRPRAARRRRRASASERRHRLGLGAPAVAAVIAARSGERARRQAEGRASRGTVRQWCRGVGHAAVRAAPRRQILERAADRLEAPSARPAHALRRRRGAARQVRRACRGSSPALKTPARHRADQVAAFGESRRRVSTRSPQRRSEACVVGLAHRRREAADQVEVRVAAQPAVRARAARARSVAQLTMSASATAASTLAARRASMPCAASSATSAAAPLAHARPDR